MGREAPVFGGEGVWVVPAFVWHPSLFHHYCLYWFLGGWEERLYFFEFLVQLTSILVVRV